MQRQQTGIAVRGPTGRMKNCSSWGEYETPGSTTTANMCNGGWYKGEYYNECESKADCLAVTVRSNNGRTADGKRYLPTMSNGYTNNEKPFGARPGSQIVGGTPNLADQIRGWGTWTPSMPTTIPKAAADSAMKPQVSMPTPMQVPVPLPYPVQPPSEWPSAMQTPYAGPTSALAGGITPTFLPQEGDSIMGRLARNIVQGWIGSAGWHTFDYARSVDMFGNPRR